MKAQGKEQGAVLVVTLVMLVVALMLGLSSYQGSRLEESMAGNYRFSSLALMAAEYGASDNGVYDLHDLSERNFISSCDANATYSLPSSWNDDFMIVMEGSGLSGLGYRYGLRCREDGRLVLQAFGFLRDAEGSAVAERLVEVDFRSELLPAFGRGMLSDSTIRVNGGATLFGNLHANKNVNLDVDASSVSNITASGAASIGSGEYDNVTVSSGVDKVEVPKVADFFDEISIYEMTEGELFKVLPLRDRGPNKGGCNLDLSGDLGGVTYFCPGKLVLSGSFNNATFFADGDVDHNGSSELSDSDSVDVGIFSTGSIEFNGQNDAYGVFWADGKMTQNGSSIIGGSMISGGDMTLNGGFTFISNSDIVVDSVPSGIVRNGWREVLL